MLKLGWDEIKIMKELGMTLEEVQRLIGLKGIASEILEFLIQLIN
jgi:DNA-binding transcriptional MerR regulator